MVWRFAGREQEVAACLTAIETHRCVVVTAPPGVGLTRFLDETARRSAHAAGAAAATSVVRLVASPAVHDVPLAALAPLLPRLDDEHQRPNEVVVRAVQGMARRFRSRRSLVVIDDAQHLDLISIEVLHGLISRTDLDVTLLLGVSSNAILPSRLSELWTSGVGTTLELGAFASDRFAAVVGDRCDDVEQLFADTGGHILLAHEHVESGAGELDDVDLVPARLRHAVERFLGPLDPGAASLVEFLSFAGPAPGPLFASIESTLAALERRGIVSSANGNVALHIPLVADVVAAGLSVRRRRALNAVMVARFNDTWRASGLELWHLMLWDARGTRVLPAQRYIDATRWALDDRRLDSAGELAAVASSKTNEVVAADVMALQTEVAAAQDAQPAASAYQLMLETTVGVENQKEAEDVRRVIFNSILSCVRRGDLATTAAIALFEDGRSVGTGRSTPTVLSISLAEVMWMSGLTGAAASMLEGIARRQLDAGEQRAYQAMQLTIATESGRCTRSVHDAQVALRTLEARHSRQFDIASTNEILARCFAGLNPDRASISSQSDHPEASRPEASRSVHAARAITLLLRGRRTEAASIARRFIAAPGAGVDSLGALDSPLIDLILDAETDEGGRTDVGHSDGSWKRWAELTSAALVVSGPSRISGRRARGLVDLAERHLDHGSITTGLCVGHFAARAGQAERIGQIMTNTAVDPKEHVLTAMCEHAGALAQQDPARAAAAATTFSRAGWFGSAADAFGSAAQLFVDEDDLHPALVAMLAHRLCATSVDASCLLSPIPTSIVSPREFDVIVRVAERMKSAAIADELGTSRRTVENHLYRLYQRFDLGSRQDVADALQAARHEVDSTPEA